MRYVHVACASLNQTPLDWEHNRNNIITVIQQAKKEKIDVLCLPELCITGYGCEDWFLSVPVIQMAQSMLFDILPETKGIVVAIGLPVLYRDGLYNTACLLVDGEIAGFVGKQHLAGSGVHYEPRWFRAWPQNTVGTVVIRDKEYPIGDLIFEVNEVRIGFEICEDAWAATRTGVNLARRSVDLILNPSASHFSFGKSEIRKRFVLEGARAFHVAYLYSNLLGNESGRVIYDGDTLIASGYNMLAEGPRFSFHDRILTSGIVDIQELRIYRASSSSYPKTLDNEFGIIKMNCDIDFPSKKRKKDSIELSKENLSSKSQISSAWEKDEYIKNQEFSRVVALGLFDYLRKSHLKGFVVNLSGGKDSAACACLVYIMLQLAIHELGQKEVKSKLFYKSLKENTSQKEKITKSGKVFRKDNESNDSKKLSLESLLLCLYQSTENSSRITHDAAKELALNLKASFADWSVDFFIREYETLAENIIKRKLNWEKDDFALQNIQSRVRAPGAWLLANIRESILLCTSNRSEAAVGYTTMDGDTAGSLSPIAGVDKTFIIEWLNWLETIGLEEIGPIPALHKINVQLPTAELRPLDHPQLDEVDLMPYAWLDTIEKCFVLEKHSPLEIFCILSQRFSEEKPNVLGKAIERFFKLWSHNQWKRERLAVGFHLDQESLDPKAWCRFPILSGGFEKEIEIMWNYINER